MDKKSNGIRLDLPGQRDTKRHRKLALAKEVFIISKKVVAAAPFVGSQLEALINVAEHIIAEVEVCPLAVPAYLFNTYSYARREITGSVRRRDNWPCMCAR